MRDIENFVEELNQKYDSLKEKSLVNRRFKHKDILQLIDKLKDKPLFEISELGKSTEGREIHLIKLGTGKLKVLLWSQMHGNEPTATSALFDIFNLMLFDNLFDNEKKQILNEITLYFVPMVNPDGAEVYKRRNALDIDLNRDAARIEAVETKLLKKLRDDIQPQYGFNLHDQEIYYAAGDCSKPATISFLAPPCSKEKEIDPNRMLSINTIILMNKILQKFIPEQVGRFNDDFMPTAFGDNMQYWGTSTILIESGGYKNDPEKQYIRKLNFLSIMTALYGIAFNKIKGTNTEAYFEIPENKKEKLFDLMVRNITIERNGQEFRIDIGIRRKEIDNDDFSGFTYYGEIADIGDLSYSYGYEEIDASKLKIQTGDILIGKKADFKIIDSNNMEKYDIENGFIK